ncbi:YibE/F family protein [Cellulomonas carbonis]|uniref:YibE/F family protein n=1 Tax=Cellulomonas carbonis T26 TaxID=947969 RepID=A0A0A0BVA2_9CELL|nr:YibE/F family protein [Cellulomonas carbonis]KGM11617.1 YibE/F family protein [Cellulomonas carbonis T26]GGC03233.1 hypothetical protein GCM10010972_15380 [Cellulomonas carbonis]
MSHPHSHPHTPVRASRRARAVLAVVLVPVLLATAVGAWLLRPGDEPRPELTTTAPGTAYATATVTGVSQGPEDPQPVLDVVIGGDGGEEVQVHVPPEQVDALRAGDEIRVLSLPPDMIGTGPGYVFVDHVRTPSLLALAVVMTVLVVAVARLRGLASLVGLGLSLAVLGTFTLPALLVGRPALAVAVVSASGIMVVVLYLAHGFSARTTTALLGTLVGVALTAGIAAWATGAARLDGLGGEHALDLIQLAPSMPLSGVVLCGFVLAGLGVLNDVTITQASAVWELRASAPDASRLTVFSRAMRIGRDHIASTVYTIAFAYVGAALPLVLLVAMSDRALVDVVGSGEIAEEVARSLVGSIGLVLAIPVTTAIAALVAGPRALVAAPADRHDTPEPIPAGV